MEAGGGARLGSGGTGDGFGGCSEGKGLWHGRATVSTIGIDKSTRHGVRVNQPWHGVGIDGPPSVYFCSVERMLECRIH